MTASKPPGQNGRDVDATGFSGHLDALLRQVPEALCAAFIDGEGETVDLSGRVDPFDARIAGAEMAVILASARAMSVRMRGQAVLELRIECALQSILVRTVSDGYDLVVVVEADTISARAAEMTAATAIALMVEANLPPPPSYAVLRSAEARPTRSGMIYQAPKTFEDRGVSRRVEAVLGYSIAEGLVQYLVRLESGEEIVVEQERATGRWVRSQ